MERAEFVFKIIFDTFELMQKLSDFSIYIRLFSLPMIEIHRLSGITGVFELQTGKSLTLKMPYAEILDECPMYIFIKSPKPGHTSERKCQHKISLQNLFSLAIQNPGRPVQQHFDKSLKNKNDDSLLGRISFGIRVRYTSSTKEDLTNLTPIIIQDHSSTESDLGVKTATVKKKDMAINTRVPLAPDPPETRTRSIFFFDKNELLEENRNLAQQIKQLTDQVQRLKSVIDAYEQEEISEVKSARRAKKDLDAQRRAQTGYQPQKLRTDYIYHPPGLQTGTTVRGRTTTRVIWK